MSEPREQLPLGTAERKATPLFRGVMAYFPAALAAVAEVSRVGNEKHNPGEPMHHARGKSSDHADCIARHLLDIGNIDHEDGLRHSAKVAWRALALLQEELEAAGAPLARGAKVAEPPQLHLPRGYWLGHSSSLCGAGGPDCKCACYDCSALRVTRPASAT